MIEEGSLIDDYCCEGFGWKVLHITDGGLNIVWGKCKNPNCPEYQANIGPLDPYRGVKTAMLNELTDWIEEHQ